MKIFDNIVVKRILPWLPELDTWLPQSLLLYMFFGLSFLSSNIFPGHFISFRFATGVMATLLFLADILLNWFHIRPLLVLIIS